MKINLESSPEFNLQLFVSAGISSGKKDKKSFIKTVVAIGLHKFRCKKNGWRENYPGTELLADWAGLESRETVSRIINNPDFSLFGSIRPPTKGRKSNTYELRPEIQEAVELCKSKGLLRGFGTDPDWYDKFIFKLKKWLIPASQDVPTFWELMNKLSTKKRSKSHTSPTQKVTLPIPMESTATTYIKTKPVNETSLFQNEFEKVLGEVQKLNLSDSDTYHFLFKERLGVTRKCANILCSRIKNGWTPESKVKALQALVNKHKKKIDIGFL